MRSRPVQHRRSLSEDQSASFCVTFPTSTRAGALFWPAWRRRGFACVRQEFTVPTSLQKSVNPLRRQLMLRASLADAFGASTDLLSVSPANTAGRPRLLGLPMSRRTPALASAGDFTAGCWPSRINHLRWRLTCTIQARSENTQMWVVWSLSALIGFCFVLSFFETAPTEARSRSRKRS
jgi:hypothetical protein